MCCSFGDGTTNTKTTLYILFVLSSLFEEKKVEKKEKQIYQQVNLFLVRGKKRENVKSQRKDCK